MKTETCSCCKQKDFFNPDGGVGMKTETCSYCKQQFLTLMVAVV